MSRHTYETTLSFGTDGEADYSEVDVKVAFDFSPGCAAQTYGPAERCYPAEDPEIDGITLLEVGGKPRPWGFHWWSDSHFAELVSDKLFASERDLERMLEVASAVEAGIEDEIAERRWADRRDGFAA